MRAYRTATGKPQPQQSFRQQPQQLAQQSLPQMPQAQLSAQQPAQMVILQQPGGGQLPMQLLDDHGSMNPM